MGRVDGREVAVVEGEDERRVEALGEGDHRGVDAAEREVGVALDQLGDAGVVLGNERLDVLAAKRPPEGSISRGPEAFGNQLSSLDGNRSRNDEA